MVAYLLDTNVIIEHSSSLPDKHVRAWVSQLALQDFYISVLTLGELRTGIKMRPTTEENKRLEIWLEKIFQTNVAHHIVPIGFAEVETWAHLRAAAPRKLPAIDSLLVATAVRHNLVLATRNTKDFKDIPAVQLFNPWEYEPAK